MCSFITEIILFESYASLNIENVGKSLFPGSLTSKQAIKPMNFTTTCQLQNNMISLNRNN